MSGYRRSSLDCRPAHRLILTDRKVSQGHGDAGVKAWLNGKLVHAMNISRGILEQPDTVDVTLNEGVNHRMLKITDDIWAWGVIVRLRPPSSAADRTP